MKNNIILSKRYTNILCVLGIIPKDTYFVGISIDDKNNEVIKVYDNSKYAVYSISKNDIFEIFFDYHIIIEEFMTKDILFKHYSELNETLASRDGLTQVNFDNSEKLIDFIKYFKIQYFDILKIYGGETNYIYHHKINKAVFVKLKNGNDILARDICHHLISIEYNDYVQTEYISEDKIPDDILEQKIKDIKNNGVSIGISGNYSKEQADKLFKNLEIKQYNDAKKLYLKNYVLYNHDFMLSGDKTIGKMCKENNAELLEFKIYK